MEKNSIQWRVVVGSVRGYATDGKVTTGDCVTRSEASAAWLQAARDVEAETGLYVSCSVADSATLYKTEWGCPEGGEESFTFYGSSNPTFTANREAYASAVVKVAQQVKDLLDQSTISIEMVDCHYTYLN